ncbi:lysozyme [Novosphingobium resinovorum]|uniref:lysozyme n=1 Tax=Novosphingobium resinovorum TaxID=158500 RepID=UPI002ED5529F|nr:lysozyme [Novosphingobium resinovorum]
MNRKPIFDAVRKMLGRSFTQAEVDALDKAIDQSAGALTASLAPEPAASPPANPPAAAPTTGRALGTAGAKLIKKWEGCARRLADGTFGAYPDPGSADGKPWTIGWGSTGADVKKGVVWTQAQCDARFDTDMLSYVKEVASFLGGAATTQNQFDALVSFHYNTGKIAASTLGKLHKAGDFAGAQAQFGKWIYNDGKPMTGLKNRRSDEAKLYGTA